VRHRGRCHAGARPASLFPVPLTLRSSTASVASEIGMLALPPALISAALAPVFFIGGTVAAELAWPGYDPIAQTISELAAGDAPTRVFMTVMFMLTAVCHGVTGVFARGIGLPGRIALMVAACSTFGVAIFPLPTVAGTSEPHRISAMLGFVILAIWPVLGMRLRREYPRIIRPWGAILGTALLATACFYFLAVWSSPQTGTVGLVERIAANAESLWPALVVGLFALADRRRARERAALPAASFAV
jgi:hypothetical membrane protein